MNLTAVKEESEVMTRHVEDSLAILSPLKRAYSTKCSGSSSTDNLSLVDVGSGAGLPGLILAIACPGTPVLPFVEKLCRTCAVYLTTCVHVRAFYLKVGNLLYWSQCVKDVHS